MSASTGMTRYRARGSTANVVACVRQEVRSHGNFNGVDNCRKGYTERRVKVGVFLGGGSDDDIRDIFI